MAQRFRHGHDRRTFMANAGIGASVLALGPLLAEIQASDAEAAPSGKTYDFDKPYNRIGWNSVKWDRPLRVEHMSHIVAGMGVADMDFPCAPAITKALQHRINHHSWGYLDMGSPGPQAFRQGIIDWNKRRYGIDINPELMGITTGVHPGIICALRAYSPPGTKVLMATPIYSGFYHDIHYTRTLPEESLMKWVNGRYEIDWEDLERHMTPDVKTTILCNPQNPVGRAWTREELTHYGELCLKHNIVVICDEIHCDFITKGNQYVPFSTLDNKDIVDNSFTMKSGSKSFSLAAMRCAWFYSTNPKLFKAAIAEDHLDLNTLGMIAEQAAYAHGGDWLDQCVAYINANQDFAHQYISENMPMIKVGQKPEGTYLLWLDVSRLADRIGAERLAEVANDSPKEEPGVTGQRKLKTPEDVVKDWFAKNAYVVLNPGSMYGMGGEGHMRMNVATSRKTLKAALDSMSSAMSSLA